MDGRRCLRCHSAPGTAAGAGTGWFVPEQGTSPPGTEEGREELHPGEIHSHIVLDHNPIVNLSACFSSRLFLSVKAVFESKPADLRTILCLF